MNKKEQWKKGLRPEYDINGHWDGYCQCNCEACQKGEEHCLGLVCRGD